MNKAGEGFLFKRGRASTLFFLVLLGLGLFFSRLLAKPADAAAINATTFTSTSYTEGATGVSYTFVFTLPSELSSAASDNFQVGLSAWGASASDAVADFCNVTLDSIADDGVDASGVVGSPGAHPANDAGLCSGFTLDVNNGTIGAGSVIQLVVSNIDNPVPEGTYFPSINDTRGNQSEIRTVPSQAFGTPMLKFKVTEPDGTTGVAGADVWIHNAYFNKHTGIQTDGAGQAFVFAGGINVPTGETRDDTYTIEVMAPSTSSFSDASPVTGVVLATGQTADYTQAPNGPVKLTYAMAMGTLKVPSGCSTCTASAGDAVLNAGIDVRDASFNPTNHKHVNSDANGAFRIGGLVAGTYVFEYQMPYDQQDYLGLSEPAAVTDFVVNADGSVTYDGTTTTAANLPVDFGDVEFRLATKTISGQVTKTGGTPVANVTVRAFKMMGMGMAQATTDSNGDYTMVVGGGTWSVMPEVDFSNNFDNDSTNDNTADWIYCGMPKEISFTNDTATESSTDNNFEVKTASVTITGEVEAPDGSPVASMASVNIFSRDGCGTHASLNWQTGAFTAVVPPGTYNINVYTWNEEYGSPPATTVTADSGTIDIGTLTLVQKQATITGRLWADQNGNGSYDSGEGVGNTTVEAFKMAKKFDEFAGGPGGGPMGGGGDWAMTQSSNNDATKGQFTLRVTKGTWMVNVMADPGMMHSGYSSNSVNYIYTGAPGQVTIATDTSSSTGNNFKLSIADATVQGRVVDGQGDGIAGIWGYAFAEPDGTFNQGPMMGMGMGGPVSNGTFTLKLPAGAYRIGVDFPPETAGYTPSDMVTVTAVAGETVTADVEVVPNNATIRVQFQDTNGAAVTNLSYAEVFMHNNAGGHQWRMFSSSDLSSGSVDVPVAAGDWYVGYHIDPTTDNYMSEPPSDNKVTAVANQTVTKEITLRAADSTVSGTVYKPNGTPLAGAWVSVDNRKASSFDPIGGPMFMQGEMTGADGAYSLNLPAGTYQVAAFFPPSAVVGGQTVSYLNPDSQEVTISASSPATVNFTFERSDATLTGTVTLNGAAQGGFVAAYSDSGGYNETTTTDGSYSLNVTSADTWNVRAMYESGSTYYQSDVYQVVMGGATTKTQDLVLQEASFTVPDAVSTTFNCANAKKITLSNGTEISIPASAITPSSVSSCSSSDSSSNITVAVTPTAQMSPQDKSIPVGVGYEISATDSNGAAISTTFNSNVSITIPYDDAQIQEAVGGTIDESLLGNGYWDTATSAWRNVNSQVLDTENNQLSISTNHFTLFGVLATTDATTVAADTGDDAAATTSTSVSTSANGAAGEASNPGRGPDVYANQGATITQNAVTVIVGENSIPFDAYLDSQTEFMLGPQKVGGLWQASHLYNLWFRATSNNAKIVAPNRPLLLSVKYSPDQMGGFAEASLVMAYSADKKNWRVLGTSVLDRQNDTVTVLTKNGGYYVLLAGYGYAPTPTTPGQVQGSFAKGADQTAEPTPRPRPAPQPTLKPSPAPPLSPPPPPPESFFQKVIDFILRR